MDTMEKSYPDYKVHFERIQTKKGFHLFFSLSTPNHLGHHLFQYDFYNCSFKAALY